MKKREKEGARVRERRARRKGRTAVARSSGYFGKLERVCNTLYSQCTHSSALQHVGTWMYFIDLTNQHGEMCRSVQFGLYAASFMSNSTHFQSTFATSFSNCLQLSTWGERQKNFDIVSTHLWKLYIENIEQSIALLRLDPGAGTCTILHRMDIAASSRWQCDTH